MSGALFPEPKRPVKSRRLVYRVVLLQPMDTGTADRDGDPLIYPPGWPVCHRFTRSAANTQVTKLAQVGVRATVQRGRITWEAET